MKIYPYLHPVPVVLVGTKNENGRANFSTIGDVAIAGLNPPLLMISLHERHLSRENIDREKKFCIIVPEKELIEKVDWCGIVSGRDEDKSRIFNVEWNKDELPYIKGVPFIHFCNVVHRAKIQKRVIYIGEIFNQIIRSDDDVKKLGNLETLMYGLDNKYYIPGDTIGTGYSEGLIYKKK